MSAQMTPSSFSYSITDVPDLDQQWQDLPNNGEMYCVPASAMNWLHYMAQHGMPRAVLINSETNPLVILMNLSMMAAYMKTDPIDGTNSGDALYGLVDYLDDVAVPALVTATGARDAGSLTFGQLQSAAMMRGFVFFSKGRYEKSGGTLNRTGGHAMSMVGLEIHGSEARIEFRDPGDDETRLTTQSARDRAHRHLRMETQNLEGEEVRLPRWGNDTSPYAFIDKFKTILPLFIITSPTDSFAFASQQELTIHKASFESDSTETKKISTPFNGELLDLAISPSATSAAMIASGENALWTLDLARDTWTKTVTSSQPEMLTYGGRDRRLFVVQGKEVRSFDGLGKPMDKLNTGVEIGAISYDQKNNRLILAAPANKRLLALDPKLKLLEDTEAPDVPGTGRLAMSVNGRDGTIVLSRADNPDVATLRWHSTGARATGKFRLMADGRTSGAHVDLKGRLIAAENGKIANFDSDGNRRRNAWFEGLSAGRLVKMARSSHNFDPIRSQRKEWKN